MDELELAMHPDGTMEVISCEGGGTYSKAESGSVESVLKAVDELLREKGFALAVADDEAGAIYISIKSH